MGSGGGVVAVSTYMGGTHGSGGLSSAVFPNRCSLEHLCSAVHRQGLRGR